MGNISGDEVYVRIVFENLGETYESKCIEAETHKDIKIMESKDNKIIISIYSDGVSGLIRDVSSFIALKNKEKAIKIHREASRKLIESRIIEENKDLQTSEQQELYKHQIIKELQQTATQSGEAEYGRFGYIQGKEGNTLWKIYMDVFGQIRPGENYNELERGSSKYFRAEFLTTQQWPYPEGEPMIWQGNAFKVYILTSSSLLNPTDPYPESDKDAVSIPLYLYIPNIGLISITVSWAQTRAQTYEGDHDLSWYNYGPRKQYPDYLGWNEILGSLNNNRPRDVGVRWQMQDLGDVQTTYTFTIWGNVIIHQYEGGYLVSHWIDFPARTFSITIK